jgi:hypothetical protein
LWEKIAGPRVEVAPGEARVRDVNREMVDRMKIWTPEGLVGPWTSDEGWEWVLDQAIEKSYFASAPLDLSGLNEWLAAPTYPSLGGINSSIPSPITMKPWSVGLSSLNTAMMSYIYGVFNQASMYPRPTIETEAEIRRLEEERIRKREEAKAKFDADVLAAREWPATEVPRETVDRKSPDYTECLTGWRTWKVEGGRLSSSGVDYAWCPGIAIPAECKHDWGDKHDAPVKDCDCGYYSFKTREFMAGSVREIHDIFEASTLEEGMGIAFGPVYVWGRVVECENGWRSEYAYPKEIWSFNPEHVKLAALYRVPFKTPPCKLAVRHSYAIKKLLDTTF